MKQEMMGWQWHQLGHMQINCTSLQTDNHGSTSPLSFYRTNVLTAAPAQPTVSNTKGNRNKYKNNSLSTMLTVTDQE